MADAQDTPPPSQVPALPPAGAELATPQPPTKLWHVVLIALVVIVFTASWLGIYGLLSSAIWPTGFFTTRRWTIPAGVLVFSLIVGLAQKYLRAPTMMHGGLVHAFKGEETPDYTAFPGAILSSYASLLSGASVGPEGPLGILVQDIAEWMREKLKIGQETALGFRVAALASAYNGIIGSALFSGVFATELGVGGSNALAYLAWNLLAGVIGFVFYTLLKLSVFAKYIAFTPINQLTLPYILYAIILGVFGALVALFIARAQRIASMIFDRIFGDRVVLRALAAGVVITVVVFFIPEVMFSGQQQLFPMLQEPARYGVVILTGFGILKLLLLALSLKSGFLGGPTFPILFACTMFGLALSLLFPGVPVSLLVLCIEAAAITLALHAPLTAILLVAVVGTANPSEVALLVLSSVVALTVGGSVQQLMAQRTKGRQWAQPKPATSIVPPVPPPPDGIPT